MAENILSESIPNKQCTKCGEVKPLTDYYKDSGRCKPCHNQCSREWRQANPERSKEIDRQKREAKPELYKEMNRRWQEANPGKCRESRQKYQTRNSDKIKQHHRERYAANREAFLERDRQWREANREKCRGYQKRYVQNNREQRNETQRKYYAKNQKQKAAYKRNWARRRYAEDPEQFLRRCTKRYRLITGGRCDFTTEQWEQIKAFYNHRCAFCGKKGKLTRDHVIPLSKGGEHTASNIIPLCHSCNCRKSNRPVTQPFQPHLYMM